MSGPEILYRSYNPSHKGCTHPGCGNQITETVDGVNGRRCAKHPPLATSRNPWNGSRPEEGAA